jgi:hypothetical protein
VPHLTRKCLLPAGEVMLDGCHDVLILHPNTSPLPPGLERRQLLLNDCLLLSQLCKGLILGSPVGFDALLLDV